MKTNREATHNHKRAGAVVVLESTAELAKVLVPSGDEFWVKLTDLTLVGDVSLEKSKSTKKRAKKDRPNASANSQYRVVRVA